MKAKLILRNRLYSILIFTIIITFPHKIYSQLDSSSTSLETILNSILEEAVDERENDEIYSILEELILNPVDINSADINRLQQIPNVTLAIASAIVNHRKKYGDFFSADELNLVEGLTNELVRNIKPFVTVKIEKSNDVILPEEKYPDFWDNLKNFSRLNMRNRLVSDLQERKGFTENKYQGSVPKIYNRLLVNYNNTLTAGIISEKDPGEKQLNEFLSYHINLTNYGIVKQLLLGDYTIQFGQGLALWSPFALSKGSDAVYPAKRKQRNITPYKSTTENNFFRGGAVSFSIQNFLITGFFSSNFYDANLDTATLKILSLTNDGLHRTENEIKKRNAAAEKILGTRADYYSSSRNISLGLLYYSSQFSRSFQSNSPFDLEGNKFDYYSLYYDVLINRINIFGESAYDGRSLASLAGLSVDFSNNFTFITSVRSYPRNYRNIHSFAFGENSGSTSNEFGIYTGIQWSTIFGKINFYFDQFKFPYATFENSLPSNGYEMLFDIRSKPVRKIETDFRLKFEKKEVTESINNLKQIVQRIRQSVRAELIFDPIKNIRMKSRVEVNNFKIKDLNLSEFGYMIMQDVRVAPIYQLNIDARIIFYRTDSFSSAIYEYENDLAGLFSSTALYGNGVRFYLLARYRLFNSFSISAKYSETYKPNEKTLGTGDSEIENNVDNKFGIQIDLNF